MKGNLPGVGDLSRLRAALVGRPAGVAPCGLLPLVGRCTDVAPSAPAPTGSNPAWVNRTLEEEGNAINALDIESSFAYDAATGQILRVGGLLIDAPYQAPFLTWGYSDGIWSNLTGADSPPGRGGASMGWDYNDGEMVLFGGAVSSTMSFTPLSDTWVYGASGWTEWNPHSHPSARMDAAMAYDPTLGGLLLFGGTNGTASYNDTWEFSGGDWSQASTGTAPSARFGAAMTWDSADNQMVLFGGGYQTAGKTTALNDSWAFSDGVWTRLSPLHSPSARVYGAMANDSADQDLVLTGGLNSTSYPQVDTWTYASGDWQEQSMVRTPIDFYGGAAYDPSANAVVLWTENYSVPFGAGGQTWEYGGGEWTEVSNIFFLPANGSPGLAWDSSLGSPSPGATLEFGGFNATQVLNQTWVARGDIWQQLFPPTAPSPRAGAVLVDDPTLDGVVLFGGGNASTEFNDTWIFRGGTWSLLPETMRPSARVSAAATYDPTDGTVLLYGGNNGTTDFNDTWTLYGNGSWVRSSITGGPGSRTDAAMAFDGTLGDPVLFGGSNSTPTQLSGVIFNDTWEYVGGAWSKLTFSRAPSPRESPGMTYDAALGAIVLFGGSSATAGLNDTWEFTAAGWQNVSEGAPLLPVVAPGLIFDPLDGVVREFGGTSLDVSAEEVLIVGYPYVFDPITLSISVSATAGAAPLPVQFTAHITGGAPALSISWKFGDGGTSSVENASYVYYRTGTFTASVTVSDGFGVNVSAGLVEAVTGTSVTPLSSRLTASPSAGTAPLNVSFVGTGTGGVPPYDAAWTFGDGGTGSGLDVDHVFSVAGNWTVVLTITDSVGGTSSSETTVRVATGPLTVHLSENRTSGAVPLTIAFTVSATGGVAPYTFAWMFGDGTTASGSSEDHEYSTVGNFTLNVTARDATGATTSATLVIRAVASGCNCTLQPGGSSSSLPAWALPAIAVIAIALVATAVGLLWRRRDRPGTEATEPAEPSPSDAEAPTDPPAPT